MEHDSCDPAWAGDSHSLSLPIASKKTLGLLLLFAADIFGTTAYIQLPGAEGEQEAAQGGGVTPWGFWESCRDAAPCPGTSK